MSSESGDPPAILLRRGSLKAPSAQRTETSLRAAPDLCVNHLQHKSCGHQPIWMLNPRSFLKEAPVSVGIQRPEQMATVLWK